MYAAFRIAFIINVGSIKWATRCDMPLHCNNGLLDLVCTGTNLFVWSQVNFWNQVVVKKIVIFCETVCSHYLTNERIRSLQANRLKFVVLYMDEANKKNEWGKHYEFPSNLFLFFKTISYFIFFLQQIYDKVYTRPIQS